MPVQWLGWAPPENNVGNIIGRGIAQGGQNFAQGLQFNKDLAQKKEAFNKSLEQEKERTKIQDAQQKEAERKNKEDTVKQAMLIMLAIVEKTGNTAPFKALLSDEAAVEQAKKLGIDLRAMVTATENVYNEGQKKYTDEQALKKRQFDIASQKNLFDLAAQGLSVVPGSDVPAGIEPFGTLPPETPEGEKRYVIKSPLATKAENAAMLREKRIARTAAIDALLGPSVEQFKALGGTIGTGPQLVPLNTKIEKLSKAKAMILNGYIRVKDKKSGNLGWVPEKEVEDDLYEEIQDYLD